MTTVVPAGPSGRAGPAKGPRPGSAPVGRLGRGAAHGSRALLGGLVLAALLGSEAAAQEDCRARSADEAEAGWTAYAAGDIDAARNRFETALATCAADHYARTGLGYVELRQDAVEDAVRLWSVVVRDEPDNVDALTGLGLARWRLGEPEAAERAFERVAELVPGHPTALEYLERMRGPAAAEPSAGREGTEAPSARADTLHAAAAEAWSRGDAGTARRLYEEILGEDPADPLALHRTALAFAWAERYDEALERMDQLLRASPGNLDARVDRARILAWSGATAEAMAAVDSVLREAPDHVPALEARALFQEWSGRYDQALDGYDRLLAITPDDPAARRRQAEMLSWTADFDASVAAYDALVAAHPDDVDARLGRARALAWSDRLDEAMGEYDRVLEREPDEPRALTGKGRTLGWAGRLVDAERVLRRAVTLHPGHAEARVALGRTLLWQGRSAAALEAFQAAVAADPADGDAREQLRALEVTLQPSARPTVSLESDSDGNRMRTAALAATWHLDPRLRLRADVYEKSVEQGVLDRSSLGASVSATYQLEPGWTLTAGAGGTDVRTEAAGGRASVRLGLASPGRYPLGGAISFSTSRLDETAALAVSGVRMSETALTARWQSAAGWRLDAGAGYAVFDGSERNERSSGLLSLSRTLGAGWSLGGAVRAFAYRRDLQDGYFDPDFYGMGEVAARWLASRGRWRLLFELAPGLQQVTRVGDAAATIRSSARLAYELGPGRELALAGGYSSAGLQSFSTGTSDYSYRAIILSAVWSLEP